MDREESQVGGEGVGEGAWFINEMSVPAMPSASAPASLSARLSGPRWDWERGFVLPGGRLQVSADGAPSSCH